MRLTGAGYYLCPFYVSFLLLMDVRSLDDRKAALSRERPFANARFRPIAAVRVSMANVRFAQAVI